MKSFLPLLSLVVVFGSCTAAYKTGQTPDDVYYSPARPNDEYVRVQKDDDRRYRGNDDARYDEDRYLRMKVRDRQRWVYLDDYYRDPYAYRYSNRYYYNNSGYCNPRSYWNYHYNPYGNAFYVPRTAVLSKPRKYNLHVFDDPKTSSTNPKLPSTSNRDYDTRSRSSNTNMGSVMRTVFGSGESSPSKGSSNNSSGSSTERSSNSSSGSDQKSNAPARKF